MNAVRGRFVCLEGIDGAGKTTAVAAVGELLRDRGVAVATVNRNALRCSSSYVDRHLVRLRRLIWEHSPGDPYLELGDLHWVHLQAAWYLAVGRCVITPLLEAGKLVLTDTWAHKFLAKVAMRPTVDFDRVQTAFADVLQPDLVIRLHLDPEVAAARKPVIAASEAGNHEGRLPLTPDGFVAYQRRLARTLDEFAEARGWVTVDVNRLSVPQVAQLLAALVRRQMSPMLAPGNLTAGRLR